MITVAATQFSLKKVNATHEFWQRFEKLVVEAKTQNAKVIVFPEYFSLSLMMCEAVGQDFKKNLHASRNHSQQVLKQAQEIAVKHSMAIVLGTLPWPQNNQLKNRSFFINDQGQVLSQDKIFMTRFEDEVWGVVGGDPLVQVFEWQDMTCAILTCYDSEFAVLSQALAREGVEVLFVPSCTDTEHGYWRVRHCCEARAIENQLFVVMSSIVEGDKNFPEIDEHFGQSAIFSPCDLGFKANGVVAEGAKNAEGIVVAALDIQKIKAVRKTGAVFNLRDAIRVTHVPSQKITFT